jgi:hypothetical protein
MIEPYAILSTIIITSSGMLYEFTRSRTATIKLLDTILDQLSKLQEQVIRIELKQLESERQYNGREGRSKWIQ